jgi:vacuolar-type H+-ATPase subunit H
MREVIQGLIEAESEARSIVQLAREEADGLVSEARQRARDLVAQSRQAARAEAAQTIEAAVAAAQQEKMKQLERAATEIQIQVRMDEATRGRLADAVVRCVIGQL